MTQGVRSARRKLDEAWFFLRKVIEARQEQIEMGYYLSAYMTAAGSVRDHVDRAARSSLQVRAVRDSWRAAQATDEQVLLRYIVDTRNTNVHERSIGLEEGSLQTTLLVVTVNDSEFRVEQAKREDRLPAAFGGEVRPTYTLRDYPGGRVPLFPTLVQVFYMLEGLVEAVERAS